MPNPNILDVSSITGKTHAFSITNIITPVLENPSNSNYVYKINSLFVSNTNGTSNSTVTVDFFRGNVGYRIASTIEVAADTTLVVLAKDTSIYLEPGDAIRISASQNDFLTGVLSYEILE
jgi:hypothetical protein